MSDPTPSASDAGHGPPRGYSSMNAHLKKYLETHPAHRAEQKSRSRCLGRPVAKKRKKKD